MMPIVTLASIVSTLQLHLGPKNCNACFANPNGTLGTLVCGVKCGEGLADTSQSITEGYNIFMP